MHILHEYCMALKRSFQRYLSDRYFMCEETAIRARRSDFGHRTSYLQKVHGPHKRGGPRRKFEDGRMANKNMTDKNAKARQWSRFDERRTTT
jgi:hypothetical protein